MDYRITLLIIAGLLSAVLAVTYDYYYNKTPVPVQLPMWEHMEPAHKGKMKVKLLDD